MQRWEYEVTEIDPRMMRDGTARNRLNLLGAQGWEVVSLEAEIAQGFAGATTKRYVALLKRPLLQDGALTQGKGS